MRLVEQIKPRQEPQILNEQSLSNLVRAINLFHGSFALTIVHCNYRLVCRKILGALPSHIKLPFQEIWWDDASESISTKLRRDRPLNDISALMCLGLEKLTGEQLEQLFIGANLQRDRLKKEISCPLVLWLDDHALQKFWNFAPELANLAAPPIKFELSLADLNREISQQIEHLLAIAKNPYIPVFWQDFKIDNDTQSMSYQELELARREMQIAYYDNYETAVPSWEEEESHIDPDLDAKLDFVLGRMLWRSPNAEASDVYAELQGEIHSVSQIYYQCSLIYWQSAERPVEAGIVLFYIGSLWWHNSFIKGRSSHDSWLKAKQFFQEAIASFQQAERLDLVAKYSRSYSGVLEQLKEWQELQKLIEYLIPLHQQSSLDLAQDYGYLAKIAVDKKEWRQVKSYAERAIAALAIIPNFEQEQLANSWLRLRHVQMAQCQLLLAQSHFQLHELDLASALIESAIAHFNPTYEPQLQARLLDTFHDIAFAQGRYLQAFEARQNQRSLEQQYGLIAFIGAGVLQPKQSRSSANIADLDASKFDLNAGEIAASGRVQDVENLMERILSGEPRLTVIHGESGVGKSSLVNAGLIPVLLQRSLIGQELLPIKIYIYPNWIDTIFKGLQASDELNNVDESPVPPRNDRQRATNLIHKLRKVASLVQVVLIFDQFEEFFFTHQPQERQIFINFWQVCLQIANLKLVVSIREDYLHLLLELDSGYVGIDILSRGFRYAIGNLSISDTKALIKNLTEQANFPIESDLIDALVHDLAGDRGCIRPIELQLVGSQLQDLNITTLADYRTSGAKQNLVERSVKEVIKACGKFDAIAQQILILLTDDQNKRPLRTYNEIRTGVLIYTSDLSELDTTLKILVGSGLVFQLLETPNNRYQLVHDYLVPFIRSQKEVGLRDELIKVRSSAQRSQSRLNLLTKFALFGTFIGLLVVSWLAFQANQQRQIAEIGEIEALVSSADSKFLLNEQLDALTIILDSAQKLNNTDSTIGREKVKEITYEALQKIIFNLRERYRFVSIKDDSPFYACRFSPDGKIVAVAGFDGTVYLFQNNGKLISQLSSPKTKQIRSVSFSPDGKKIAASGAGSIVRIWDVKSAKVIAEFTAHQEAVFKVEFHPDGRRLLTGGHDGLVKVWDIEGDHPLNLLTINPPNTLKPANPDQANITYAQKQSEVIQNAGFSPDGKMIIAAKNRAISLWDLQGNMLANQVVHSEEIRSVKFHPNGDKFASSSNDKSVKIWQISNQILEAVSSVTPKAMPSDLSDQAFTMTNSLNGNRSNILSLAFSKDGRRIALGGQDNSIQVFELNGMIDTQLGKHQDSVLDLDFSPDNKYILSAGKDRNARLWFVQNTLIETMYGHRDTIWSVSFNPNSKMFASGSVDRNIRIWNRDGTSKQEIKGHDDIVYGVSFSSDGQKLLSASRDQTVRVWDSNTGAQLHLLKIHGAPLINATLSPDQKVLATLGEDNKIKLWRWDNTDNPPLMHTFEHSQAVWSIAFSPDSKSIASTGDHQAVKVWDVASGQVVHDIAKAHGNNGGLWVAYSHNGKSIGSVGKDGKLKLWDSQSGKLQIEVAVNNKDFWIFGLSFSPDDRNVAVANSDKTIKIFDTTSGELLKTLTGHNAEVHALSYSPDGEYVVSASRDSTLKLWKAETLPFDQLVQRGCSLLQDYLQNSPNSKSQKICRQSSNL